MKSIAGKKPPRLCEKGMSAEAFAGGKAIAGSSENIRPVVAEMRRAIENFVIFLL